VLLNIKSAEIDGGRPQGRPPNIISALRLLDFLANLLGEKPSLVDKAAIWFLAFYYRRRDSEHVVIESSCFRDLFKLDLSRAPSSLINFDAAIQIQWHVMDMQMREDQTVKGFAKELANHCEREWRDFSKERTKRLREIVEVIKRVE